MRYDITTGPVESLGDVYINGELIDPERYELRYDCINDISYALFLKEYVLRYGEDEKGRLHKDSAKFFGFGREV